MATASRASRSTLIRNLFKKQPSIPSSSRFSISPPTSPPPPFFLRRAPTSPSSFSFRLPRELSSLLPAYSAIASARLVSRLPDELSSVECLVSRLLDELPSVECTSFSAISA